MYRKIEDFQQDWAVSSKGTLKAIQALKDDKLDQAIVEGHNTLGWLAKHLIGSMSSFGGLVGFNIPAPTKETAPKTVDQLVAMYEASAAAVAEQAKTLTDEDMTRNVQSFKGEASIGNILRGMIDHQTHHRGQMTVLIRQAGLDVPSVMGPTKEMSQ
ncbi:DinB family protein [Kurthia sibirica]|uniref:Damage-inducible protein DinB n=1 Tax=Kurthia sibirica TaxID=202750 RepID=A0A2U3AIP2_9BACL|nr:DinB family protein [Kurthia sibirica]PWI24377.1 damage-inducible protein DinB [Kurthia sibirica]GEK33794.1 hypothetical protein KSI01_13270 [Kurthia sibirica]